MPRLLLLSVLLAAASVCNPARAARSYDTCTGYVDALPAVIAQPGTWCLRANLSTPVGSGNAITLAAHNVTLDCNDFRIDGLSAGVGTRAIGVYASDRGNLAVRNCTVRGFYRGIWLDATVDPGRDAVHRVEDNRLDQNRYIGIQVEGPGSRVARNLVRNTGGAPDQAYAYGIYLYSTYPATSQRTGEAVENTVEGVFAAATTASYPYGIVADTAIGNQVRALTVQGTGQATGISPNHARDNHVVAAATGKVAGVGLNVPVSPGTCVGNSVAGFALAFRNCPGVTNQSH